MHIKSSEAQLKRDEYIMESIVGYTLYTEAELLANLRRRPSVPCCTNNRQNNCLNHPTDFKHKNLSSCRWTRLDSAPWERFSSVSIVEEGACCLG